MDAHIAATEALVIDGLQYKLKPNGEYVTSRQSVSFHPSGSNFYQPVGGTKVIRLVIADSAGGWLDGDSVSVQIDVVNDSGDNLKQLFCIAPWAFFKRMRITCGGALVEEFDYARTHQMFDMMKPMEVRHNDSIEAFNWVKGTITETAGSVPHIDNGKRKTVCFKLLSGLLQSNKFLPLSYMKGGLVIELELCNNYTDPIISVHTTPPFNADAVSERWHLENVQIKADLVRLDNGFQNSYDEHMLSGGMLAINFAGYVTSSQSISGNDVTINLSRQASRLKNAYISFNKSANNGYTVKEWEHFYHPMNADAGVHNPDRELEWQIQIGGVTYPQTPVNSIAETFSQLRKTVAHYGKKPVSLTPTEYQSSKFVISYDFEMLSEVGYTGVSTTNGQMITVKVKPKDKSLLNSGQTAGTDLMPDQLFMVLCTDNILELRDSGISVLD